MKHNRFTLWSPDSNQPVGNFIVEKRDEYTYALKATTRSVKNRIKLFDNLKFFQSHRFRLALLDSSANLVAKDLVVRMAYITPKDLTAELFWLVTRY